MGPIDHLDNISGAEDERKLVFDKSISRQSHNCYIYVVTMMSAVGGLLFGYDTGVISGAMVFIRDQFALDSWWQEFIVSATILSAWIFSMIAGGLTDTFGRKRVILLASIIFTVGSVVMAFAWSKYLLLIGRFTVGAAIGLAAMTIPMYLFCMCCQNRVLL